MSNAVKLTGLWKADRLTKQGLPYYSGKVRERIVIEAGSMVCLFKNTPGEGYDSLPANAPEFDVTVLPPRDQQGTRPQPAPQANDQAENGDVPW